MFNISDHNYILRSKATCFNKEPWIVIPKSRRVQIDRAAFAFHSETNYVDQHRNSIFTLEDTLPLILPNPLPFGLLSSQSVLNQT